MSVLLGTSNFNLVADSLQLTDITSRIYSFNFATIASSDKLTSYK